VSPGVTRRLGAVKDDSPGTGEMAAIDYSDATPDVAFTYTRLGQQATVTDATGTREFAYSATTLDLISETLPAALYGGKTLTRTRDALGRFVIGLATVSRALAGLAPTSA